MPDPTEQELARVRAEMATKQDLQVRMELKEEIRKGDLELYATIHRDFAEVRDEIHRDFAEFQAKLSADMVSHIGAMGDSWSHVCYNFRQLQYVGRGDQ